MNEADETKKAQIELWKKDEEVRKITEHRDGPLIGLIDALRSGESVELSVREWKHSAPYVEVEVRLYEGTHGVTHSGNRTPAVIVDEELLVGNIVTHLYKVRHREL